jgi:hypothetical protein
MQKLKNVDIYKKEISKNTNSKPKLKLRTLDFGSYKMIFTFVNKEIHFEFI